MSRCEDGENILGIVEIIEKYFTLQTLDGIFGPESNRHG